MPRPPGNSNPGCFKAALLSGPPGIGKTTVATVVARSLGYDILELNASDTRSKKSLQQELSDVLDNTVLAITHDKQGHDHGAYPTLWLHACIQLRNSSRLTPSLTTALQPRRSASVW